MTESDDLYGLALDEFIPARNARAKQLRADGEKERARQVSTLRKPSVPAWAVNQLVRSQRRQLTALFEAGDELTQAQDELLSGSGDSRALREALERERAAVAALVDQARGLLSADGHEMTGATLEKLADTLHAAALDSDARSEVSEGCLERDLRHVGLGPLGAPAAALPPGSRTRRAKGSTTSARDDRRDETKAQQRAAAERLKAARQAEAEADRAQAEADRARAEASRVAKRAEREFERAKAARAAAEETLVTAREALQRATAAHRQAQKTLQQLEKG